MGTKDIPNLTAPISATWFTASSDTIGGAGHEVDMVEDEARRGDHDEED